MTGIDIGIGIVSSECASIFANTNELVKFGI